MTMRTRDLPPNSRVTPGISGLPVAGESLPPPLDRDLTIYRDGVRWTFSSGKVLANGIDIHYILSNSPSDIATWVGLADGLSEYRKRIARLGSDSDQFAKFEAVIDSLLGKILGRMKKIYDQKMSGLSWTMQDGQLILNGINIRSFMALYRIRKTEKARKFLRGLARKLAMILENPQGSPDYERIHGVVSELYGEIGEVLSQDEASGAPRRLMAPQSRSA